MTMIQEQIEILVALQGVELELIKTGRLIESLNDEAAGLDQAVAEREMQVAGEKSELDALKKSYRVLESESKVNLAMIAKSNEKLRVVKTNKEYQSILKEIDDLRKKNSEIEDLMIEQLDRIESQEKAIDEHRSGLASFLESCRQKKQAIESRVAGERHTIGILQEKSSVIRASADPKTLAVLDNVKSKVRGMAVVPAQKEVCMGCHMNIPAQLFNELLRYDELRFCPHCHRIIYWKERESD